jgi:peptide/nickel transport system permease protein
MISNGRQYIYESWWTPIFAGIALTTVIVCVNVLGDWLRDRFDPQMIGQRLPSVF